MAKLDDIWLYLMDKYEDRLRHNLITDKEEYCEKDGPWQAFTTRDVNTIACECSREFHYNITDRDVWCVLRSDHLPSVHPLREWLKNRHEPYQPTADITPIDYLASEVVVVESERELWRQCFHKWFVAMVASWLKDDVVNHEVLVLIGPQGIYKTTWLERLLPPELRQYVASMPSVREMTKDDRLRIAESALINIDEIDALTERELNQLKSIITASDVNERAAYARTKERRIRIASFCASGNKDQFLTDMTGNRRWLPFHVESIQNPFLNPTQPWEICYAQALWEIEHGFEYWFDHSLETSLEQHRQQFMKETNEEQLIPVYYEPVNLDYNGAVLRTTAEISARLTLRGNIKQPMSLNNLGKLLHSQGFQQVKRHGYPKYIVRELENDAADKQREISQVREAAGDSGDSGDSTS